MRKAVTVVNYLVSVMLVCAATAGMARENLCPSTKKSREWSAGCFEKTAAGLQVKSQHRQNIHANGSGYAAIITGSPLEVIAVSKAGKVVPLQRKHLKDFHFKPPESEISRFGYVTNQGDKDYRFKCGYYRVKKFKILVPPIYDLCAQMVNGRALVCTHCVARCDSEECDKYEFFGSEGLIINDKNEVIDKIKLASPARTAD